MAQEVIRKGPWTDNEDSQLGFYVNLFGDRRWDFIAKVSGLKRTGKSCRLRWVNYLHPGLRRGKMTPHEERLVLELHANWGNRWSRIARKLPGRTDNEIKNYWRTHMRKKAQEMKQSSSPLSSSSYTSSSSSSSITTMPMVDTNERNFYDIGEAFTPSSLVSNNSCNSSFDSIPFTDTKETIYYDMGGLEVLIPNKKDNEEEKRENTISMDDIWKEIEQSQTQSQELQKYSSEIMISPIRNHYHDSLWVAKEENKIRELVFPPATDYFFPFYGLEGTILTE